MKKMEVIFGGNGDATDDIEKAVCRLVEDLNSLGNRDRSFWNLSIGAGSTLISRGEQIVNDAKSILSLIKGYVGNRK
jgi:hypothetical protein